MNRTTIIWVLWTMMTIPLMIGIALHFKSVLLTALLGFSFGSICMVLAEILVMLLGVENHG